MSANSELIKEWFLKSLTARAAYAYFTGLPATNTPIRQVGAREMAIGSVIPALISTVEGQQATFSEDLAEYFVAHFATLDHLPNTENGYSATLPMGLRASDTIHVQSIVSLAVRGIQD